MEALTRVGGRCVALCERQDCLSRQIPIRACTKFTAGYSLGIGSHLWTGMNGSGWRFRWIALVEATYTGTCHGPHVRSWLVLRRAGGAGL